MKNNPLITIIVPFYNKERYIAPCIKSLKAQTNRNFKCILIDDGSIDKSREYIADEIKNDKRFSLILHERNLGIGAGRGTGIQNTKTEYLTFLDVDDELETDAVDKILDAIRKQKADLYVFDYFIKNELSEVRRISGDAKNAIDLFPENDSRISRVWHKIFHTSLFKDLDFSFLKTTSFAEDLYICIHCFINSQETLLVSDAYYYYIYNGDSLVHSRTEKSIRDEIVVMKNLLAQKNLKLFPEIETYIQNESFNAFGQLIFPNKKNPFQWNRPHFDEWCKINAEKEIFIPAKTHPFVRFYIALIKARLNFVANIAWNIIKILEGAKQVIARKFFNM